MREVTVEQQLRAKVEAAGGLCIKLPANIYSGIPDRIVLLPGPRIYFIELKKDKNKKPSPRQQYFINILFTLGARVIIIKGKPDLENFLNEHVKS